MVNKHTENQPEDIEITNDAEPASDPDLADVEASTEATIKKLQTKLHECETARRTELEATQRAKADFLNARKRLEEARLADQERHIKQFVESLLPLCDSFTMALRDTEAWAKADPAWRTGVEGIHTQLKQILKEYNVTALDPVGEPFDPHQHESVGTTPVTDAAQHDQVVNVLQLGYQRSAHDQTTLIRPARVILGHYEADTN